MSESEEYAVPATGALIFNENDEIFLMKSPNGITSGLYLVEKLRKATL